MCGEYQVTVRDDDGEPVLLVPCGGVVCQVARRRCHAALLLNATAVDGVGLTLVGRLAEAPAAAAGRLAPDAICHGCPREPGAECSGWTTVVLSVERVHTSCPRDQLPAPASARREIPLPMYAVAEPAELAASIPWIVRHLNSSHHLQLRAAAARCGRLPLADVIGAEISQLSASELRIWWVGPSGASPIVVAFPMPVQSLDELGRLLRGYLDGVDAAGTS